MPSDQKLNSAEVRQAFLTYERDVRIRNYKVGCVLALIFVPIGVSLDYFVYPNKIWGFLGFWNCRLLCSLMLAGSGRCSSSNPN